MGQIGGFFILLIGILIGGWIAYNFLIERQPEAEGKRPLPAIITSVACTFVGYRWLRGQQND